MICRDLIRILEEKYPRRLAEDWDNVGLLLGEEEKEIGRVLFALDVTNEVISYAKAGEFDMIITHHPMIFRPIKQLRASDPLASKIFSLVKAGINVYTLHTNLDAQKGGLNDYILEKLGIHQSKILAEEEDMSGIGRTFYLEEEKSLEEIETWLMDSLSLDFLRRISSSKKVFRKLCLVNGSGMSYWKLAASKGVDLFITGDISYHDALDLSERGLSALDIGHLEAERFFAELLERDLRKVAEGEGYKHGKENKWAKAVAGIYLEAFPTKAVFELAKAEGVKE